MPEFPFSDPLRLIRVVDRLNIGGPTHHVLLLTRDLAPRGYETVLVKGQVAEGEAEMTGAIARVGVGFVEIDGLTKAISLRDARAFWHLYRLLRRVRPQVVHTHKTKAGVLGRLAAWLCGVPVVVHTFHGHAFRGYFSPLKSWLFEVIERVFAHHTDAVVAVSRQQRRELLGYAIASPKRLHAIPLGLDLGPFLRADRSDCSFRDELGIGHTVPLVGMVGRMVPIKGVEVFLHAVQHVHRMRPDVEFVVVGDGELRADLEGLAARLGLLDRLRFTGFREDVARIYASLDLVVLSSFNEGLPVTLIEAVAAGCYAVATQVGGVPDLVDSPRIGTLVPSGDVDALARAMVCVLDEGRQVPLEDRQRIGRLYGVERLVDDLDHLYRTLLKRTHERVCRDVDPAGEGNCQCGS